MLMTACPVSNTTDCCVQECSDACVCFRNTSENLAGNVLNSQRRLRALAVTKKGKSVCVYVWECLHTSADLISVASPGNKS